ncbi:MAG TPA: ABC transporter substrate-binding protein [Mucilaginibacter sp.]|jgi:NitT/TauT family transport system substrate-binding protein
MKTKITIALAILFLTIGCTNHTKNATDSKLTTTLKLNWIFTGSFAPEAFSAKNYAAKNNLTLKLEPGGQGKDPLKLVKDNEFGAAAADEILHANDKGADFVIVGLINYDSPACFISQEKDNIKTPKDFEGKTVGILPFGSTGLIYKILLKKARVDESKIKEVSVYPDLKIFLTGHTHQVQPAFIYDETVSLDLLNVKYNIIEPAKYGVVFKGPCYFTTAKTVAENPALVKAFIATMAQGMNAAIARPVDAVKALKAVAPEINESRELKVWVKGAPYYRGHSNKPLTWDIDSWTNMVSELMAFKELKQTPNLNKTLNATFIDDYYKK